MKNIYSLLLIRNVFPNFEFLDCKKFGIERWLVKFLILIIFTGNIAFAQVGPPTAGAGLYNGYSFAQSNGTYTPLPSSKTTWEISVLLSFDAISAPISLPWDFKFNGKTYKSIRISNNGFITFGKTAPESSSYSVISDDALIDGAVAGFSSNLKNANLFTSEISYAVVGSSFVVQFTDLQGSSSATQKISFQIILNSTDNSVSVVYGNCVSGNATLIGEVGLKGADVSDVNNRTGTNWSATTPGTSKLSTCTFGNNSSTIPASGLTFTYLPGIWKVDPSSYASIPFTEDFSAWGNGNSINDLPNVAFWRTWPSRGDSSWRASDNTISGFFSSSGWTDIQKDFDTPVEAPAVSPAAKFHSYEAHDGNYGYMDLYVDLSSDTRAKEISFNYRNQSGRDSLRVQFSADGGATFVNLGKQINLNDTWSRKYFYTNSSSATSIIRFLAKSDFGDDDIYIDNVSVIAVDCPPPTDTDTYGLSTTAELVSWKENGTATSWDIEYGVSNFAPTGVPTVNLNTNSYKITGLSPGTTYKYYLRSNCGGGNSIWSGPYYFTTLCSAVNVPYNQNFEDIGDSYIPPCTTVQSVNGNRNWNIFSYINIFGLPFTGRVLIHIADAKKDSDEWFYTQGVNLNGGMRYEIKFRIASYFSFYTEKLKVLYGTEAINTSMTNLIADYPSVIKEDASYDTYYFTPASSGIYYFGFNAYSAKAQYAIFLDDIYIDFAPNCLIPGAPVISNVTASTAMATWTPPIETPSNGYDVYYSKNFTEPTDSTVPSIASVSALSVNLTGLDPGNDYGIWVRANCSTSKGDWTYIKKFTTLCLDSYNVPYNQDFEYTEDYTLPHCSSDQVLSGTNTWRVIADYDANFTNKWLICDAYGANLINTWYYTPGINLEAGKSYNISYDYAGGSATEKSNLKVAYGTSAINTSMTNVIADYANLNNGANIIHASNIITPSATGVYYFGFFDYNGKGDNVVAVDNISITESTLSTDESLKDDVKIYPNPFKDEITISNIKDIKSIGIIDYSGRLIKEITNVTPLINLEALTKGIYLLKLNYKDGTIKIKKVIKK